MDTSEPAQNPRLLENNKQPVREHLLVLDSDLRVQAASKSFYIAFQAAPGETVGKKLAELGKGQWNVPALLTGLNELLKADAEFNDLEMEHDLPAPGAGTMLIGARRLSGSSAPNGMVLLSIRDATTRTQVEWDAGALMACRAPLPTIGYAVIAASPEGNVTLINPTAEKPTGWSRADALPKRVT